MICNKVTKKSGSIVNFCITKKIWILQLPCNPANICWSSRRPEYVFQTSLEDVFNTSSA